MAFSIGGKYSIHEINRDDFCRAAAEIGLGERMAMQRFDRMCGLFESGLCESAAELNEMGFTKVKDIKERILKSSGSAHIL